MFTIKGLNMLKELIQKFATDVEKELNSFTTEKKGAVQVSIGPDLEVILSELKPGILFESRIGEVPKARKEELFSFLMHANVLGQGTGGAALGLTGDEKFLTLSLDLAYDINYTEFKERLEEFSNFTVYWKEELERFKTESEQSVVS